MNFVGRKVNSVKMHAPIFIVGSGELPQTLVKNSASGKMSTLDMTFVENGVFVKINGTEALVPFGQIQVLVFAPEEKPAVSLAKVK